MAPLVDGSDQSASASLNDALDVLLRFGAAMLRAGNTAYRVREWMAAVARALDLDDVSVAVALTGITVAARRGGARATMMREFDPPGVNSSRIAALEELARAARPGTAPHEIAARLDAIETEKARYRAGWVAVAVGAGCGAFAFLSGGDPLEMAGAGIGGGIGQHLRGRLIGAGFNQNGVTALVAVAACGLYALIAATATRLGLGDGTHAAGFISSILFLVPGFPLVAALLDLLQYQAAAALTRFAYAMTIVLAAAFGMSIVVALVGFDLAAQPPFAIAPAAKLVLRALASFVGGAAFAMLFNNPPRVALVIGLLALAANLLRLELNDAGMMLAPATFLGVLAVGLLASLTRRRLGVPLITITVPAIIVMVPGVYAFQAIVLFNQARMIEALQAASSCAFVTGAMAAGLATARFLSERWSSAER